MQYIEDRKILANQKYFINKHILFFSTWLVVLATQNVMLIIVLSAIISISCMASSRSIDKNGFYLTWPFFVLVVLGVFQGVGQVNLDSWDYARDLMYILRFPLIAIATIALIGKRMGEKELVAALMYAGIFLSLYYLAIYVINDGLELTRRELQTQIGRGYILPVYAAVLLLISNSTGVGIRSISLRVTFILIIFISVFATTSRTQPAVFVAFILFWYSFKINRSLLKLALPVGGAAIVISSIPPFFDFFRFASMQIDNDLVVNAVNEIFSSDFYSYAAIQSSFRSYEALMAWREFLDNSVFEKFFGAGFGSRVALEVGVTLGSSASDQRLYTSVPYTHMSILTALVKFGILGVIFYVMGLFNIFRVRQHSPEERVLIFMNQSSVALLMYVMFLFQGFFSTLEVLYTPFVVSIASCYLLHRSRRNDELFIACSYR